MDRDRELDELQEELRRDAPHIERPDEVDVRDGGLCWNDKHRLCGPACVAFGDPDAPTPADRCQILGLGAALVTNLLRKPAVPSIPVPDPFGRKP